MKQGRAPADLIEEITRQRESKVDYVTDTRHLSLTPGDAGVRLNIAGHDDYEISDHTHHQVAERVGIPAKYYNTMLKDAPDLLRTNVNHWFQAKPEKRMVRTLDGRVRAFLSDRYRPLDNYDLTLAVLPVLAESGASLESCEVTDDRMYLKGVLRSVQTKIPAPAANGRSNAATDVVVSPGIVISNSEIGTGALAVQPAVHFLNCLNMATWARHTLRKFHIGKQLGDEDGEVSRFFSENTRTLSDAALWSKVHDMAVGALKGGVFEQIVTDLTLAREQTIDDPLEAVHRIVDTHSLPNNEESGILKYLVEGGDLSKFGLSNAVTRYSQDTESYDRASFLEQLGGEIITLGPQDWANISRN